MTTTQGAAPTKEQLEYDKLKREVEQLSRPWYRTSSGWVAIFTVLVAIGGILMQAALSNWDYKLAEVKKERADLEIAKTEKKRAEYLHEIDSLSKRQKQLSTANADLIRRNETLASEYSTRLQQENAQKPEDVAKLATEASISAKSSKIAPRVYILINDESQRAAAESAATALQAHGYLIPFIKVNRNSPDQTTVKYFDLDVNDAREAEGIATILRNAKIKAAKGSMPAPQNRSAFRPRHFELWFGRLP